MRGTRDGGIIKLVLDGVIQATPFLDASSWVTFGGDEGLLSMAFAPDYSLELDENSTFHNFHLLSSAVSCVPSSNWASTVAETGHQTWTVNFRPGPVTYQCDPHAELMHGTFKVVR